MILAIKENKFPFVIELLESPSFVKVKPIFALKDQEVSDISEAIQEFKMVRKGKLKAISVKELLDELEHKGYSEICEGIEEVV